MEGQRSETWESERSERETGRDWREREISSENDKAEREGYPDRSAAAEGRRPHR